MAIFEKVSYYWSLRSAQLSLTKCRRKNVRYWSLFTNLLAPILLLLVRVIRRWNQTGQKHAGGPDIVNFLCSTNPFLLWLLVLVAYLDAARRLSRCGLPLASRKISFAVFLSLCFAALRFKIAFTYIDAPELCIGLPKFLLESAGNTSLVGYCRIIFLVIGAIITVSVFAKVYYKLSGRSTGIGMLADTTIIGAYADEFRIHPSFIARTHNVVANDSVTYYEHPTVSCLRSIATNPKIFQSLCNWNNIQFFNASIYFFLCVWRV